ncbi:hypothetical protein [Nocardiopsis sp. NPDC057823]|uniref:hypothetical protein n=1 Tax=Nocardiopsis sp. NPDC057823 TaxID=3346256 RepID=UPI00367109A7
MARLPKSSRVRARSIEAARLHASGVPALRIALMYDVSVSNVYRWISTGRVLLALEDTHPGAAFADARTEEVA